MRLPAQLKRGFTLIEVVVAVAVIGILAATIYPALGNLVQKSKRLQYDSQASLLLQEGMEATYNVFLSDWNQSYANYAAGEFHPAVAVTGSGSEWVLVDGEQTGLETMFSRKVEVQQICRSPGNGKWWIGNCVNGAVRDENSLLIKTTVTWREFGTEKSIEAELLLANLEATTYAP